MLKINAEIRKEQGKRGSRRLRRAKKLPAIIYGNQQAPVSIELNHDIMLNIQTKENFYREPLTLVIQGQETAVKVKMIQRHPFKLQLMHIDFICT